MCVVCGCGSPSGPGLASAASFAAHGVTALNPAIEVFQVSATRRRGMNAWLDGLQARTRAGEQDRACA